MHRNVAENDGMLLGRLDGDTHVAGIMTGRREGGAICWVTGGKTQRTWEQSVPKVAQAGPASASPIGTVWILRFMHIGERRRRPAVRKKDALAVEVTLGAFLVHFRIKVRVSRARGGDNDGGAGGRQGRIASIGP
jgi:hypothetical protein